MCESLPLYSVCHIKGLLSQVLTKNIWLNISESYQKFLILLSFQIMILNHKKSGNVTKSQIVTTRVLIGKNWTQIDKENSNEVKMILKRKLKDFSFNFFWVISDSNNLGRSTLPLCRTKRIFLLPFHGNHVWTFNNFSSDFDPFIILRSMHNKFPFCLVYNVDLSTTYN